jgi:hypothetical protein
MMRIPKAEAAAIATLGVDICKNTFRPIGHKPGAIVLRELAALWLHVRDAHKEQSCAPACLILATGLGILISSTARRPGAPARSWPA